MLLLLTLLLPNTEFLSRQLLKLFLLALNVLERLIVLLRLFRPLELPLYMLRQVRVCRHGY